MAHLRRKDQIPLYSADNDLREWISPQRAARLEALGIVRVVRHKRGNVNRCIMQRHPSDPSPTKLSAYLGTRYSYLERLESGRSVWALRKLQGHEERPHLVLEVVIHA